MVERLPANQITPHGWYHLVKGNIPLMRLTAYDGSVEIYMMGGHSIPDRVNSPESVRVTELTGLVAPWEHITQKGATQDGVTHIDALYSPIEVGLKTVCTGRDPRHTRRVVDLLYASIDAKQESKLEFIDNDLGHWWAPVRWFKGGQTAPTVIAHRNQPVSLRLQADDGFWRTYDDVAEFSFTYDSVVDDFADPDAITDNWPAYFFGDGDGDVTVANGVLEWVEDGAAEAGVFLGPYKDFDTETDNQVIEIELGSVPEIIYPIRAYNVIGGRMGRDSEGDWDGNGVLAFIGRRGLFTGVVELVRYNDFTPTVMATRTMLIAPHRRDRFTLICGTEDDPRQFRVLRRGWPVLTHKESGDGSELGEDYRGVGLGLVAGQGGSSQRSPATVLKFNAGDNATISQQGWLECHNIGDQHLYYDYQLHGPGTFKVWDGPESDEFVEFGPVEAGQVIYLRSDPRVNTTLVEDLTAVPATPEQQARNQGLLGKFLSFAFGNTIAPLLEVVTSIFGVRPPQGNLYALLDGRFSGNAAIPPKSPGNPARPYFVKVAIDDGNADSKIIASGTPLRRYPI